MKRKRTAYRRHRHRRQKTRNRGGAKGRAVTAALSTVKTGAIGVADAFAFGQLGALERTRANDGALSSLKADVKYVLVSIENCNRLLDYMYRKKIKCVKKSPQGNVLVNRLVCNPQLESQLRELMRDLLDQLNALKDVDPELGAIIASETDRLHKMNDTRYAEVIKLTTRRTPSRGHEPARAGEAPNPVAASPTQANAMASDAMAYDAMAMQQVQQAQIELEHLKQAVELARVLRNEHSTRDDPPPPLVKVTESKSMFRHAQRKKVQITLSEYLVATFKYPSGTKCETLLHEYMTRYVNEAATSKQKSDFVHRLFGWYGSELVKAQQQQQHNPMILLFNEKGNEMNNHTELLYLFYTFLDQFDDPSTAAAAEAASARSARSAPDVKGMAINKVLDVLRTSDTPAGKEDINNVLQAIVHPKIMEELLTSREASVRRIIDMHVGEGHDERMVGAHILKKAAVVKDKVMTQLDVVNTRSNMVNARADIQSTMLNLNTVYQSLLFQVMTVVNDEPHTMCSKDFLHFFD